MSFKSRASCRKQWIGWREFQSAITYSCDASQLRNKNIHSNIFWDGSACLTTCHSFIIKNIRIGIFSNILFGELDMSQGRELASWLEQNEKSEKISVCKKFHVCRIGKIANIFNRKHFYFYSIHEVNNKCFLYVSTQFYNQWMELVTISTGWWRYAAKYHPNLWVWSHVWTATDTAME